MNPEFQRNLWLELSGNRLVFMPVVLSLFFLAAILISSPEWQWRALSGTAEVIFLIVAILWGTRSAAAAIPEEIRERTWDFQRLSSLAPWTMVWGKLFGATAYQWYGAAICLAVIGAAHVFGDTLAGRPLGLFLATMMMTALLGMSLSLLASLVGLRRGYANSRYEVFAYQLIGLIAALALDGWWETIGMGDTMSFMVAEATITNVAWYGANFAALDFVFVSVLVALGWILLGCRQMMRAALRVQNGPWVWIAFVLFLIVYAAGFVAPEQAFGFWADNQRTLLAFLMASGLTYAMVFLEPKEIVEFRWLTAQLGSGNYGRVFGRLPSWTWSLIMAAVALVALIAMGHQAIWNYAVADVNLVAAFGFLIRDVGIFLFFAVSARQMRGDLGALISLVVLYGVVPIIFGQTISENAMALFLPFAGEMTLVSIVSAFVQATVVWVLTTRQLSAQIAGNPS